jgi:hypothetical protein
MFTASNNPSHKPFVISDLNQDIHAGTGNDAIGMQHGTTVNEVKIFSVNNGDAGVDQVFSTGIPVSTSTQYYVRLERLSSTETRLSVFSDATFSTHIASSPVTLTVPSTIDGLRYVHSQNSSDGGAGRTLTGTLDNLSIQEGCPAFTIDSVLIIPVNTIDEEFTIDGCLKSTATDLLFTVDACVGLFAGRRSRIGDIILLCLTQQGPLTGQEIVDHVNTFTQANGISFVGKTSRVKNWIGFLEREGLIQQDFSDPDWYETTWSIV